MDFRCHNLAFLLSLSSLPLGCGGGTSRGGSETSGDGSAGNTTSTSKGQISTTGVDGASESEGSSGSSGSTSDESISICHSLAAKYVECDFSPSYESALAYCKETLSAAGQFYGEECEEVYSNLLGCYASSTCVELNSGEACLAEGQQVLSTCATVVGATCQAYGLKAMMCTDVESEDEAISCQQHINANYQAYGPACGSAYEDLFACLTTLECVNWGGEDACPLEIAMIAEEC